MSHMIAEDCEDPGRKLGTLKYTSKYGRHMQVLDWKWKLQKVGAAELAYKTHKVSLRPGSPDDGS